MFAELVVAHRRRLGLTQEELAGVTGLSPRTVRDLESGRGRVPRPSSVRLLADAFGLHGVQRDDFLGQAAGGAVTPVDPVEVAAAGSDAGGPVVPVVPVQLPADVAGFVGRQVELAELDRLLTGAPAGGAVSTAVVISAVSGTAGVGKTGLAVRWAHRVRNRFPDGQLYVNLRGYGPDRPLEVTEALARLLTALGVTEADIPVEVDERATRYRMRLADRRMLIVLDNASGAEQVRPLLPGTASCVVVVTSRDSLAGLVARDGAHRVELDLLPADDAVALLRRLIGARVDADPEAATALAAQCARLPLALRVAAELAASRPAAPLSGLVAELADQQRRLNRLDAGGDTATAVAAVFSWSLRNLPAESLRMFRLVGLHPGPDFDVYAAAALGDYPVVVAADALDGLARAHLIQPCGGGRYGMHDLLRAYAASTAPPSGGAEHDAALRRLVDYYVGTAAAAMDRLYPAEADARPRVAPPTTPVPQLNDPDAARRWLDATRACLTAICASGRWPADTVRLSHLLFRYLVGSHDIDGAVVHDHARAAAQQLGDVVGEARAWLGSAVVQRVFGRPALARECFNQALALFRRAGDAAGEAHALTCLGVLEVQLGEYSAAADHHRRAAALFRDAENRLGHAGALTNLGIVERLLGRYDSALSHLHQALTRFEQAGDLHGQCVSLINLGAIERRLGRYRHAGDHDERAAEIAQRIGYRRGEAWALVGLGTLATTRGHPEQANALHDSALTIFRDIADRVGESNALNGLGEAANTAGYLDDALTHHATALAIAADMVDLYQQARAHTGLGRAYHALHDITRARHHYTLAVALHSRLGTPETTDLQAILSTLTNANRR
jgi:tetratricopeptide (TPR) repeat protein